MWYKVQMACLVFASAAFSNGTAVARANASGLLADMAMPTVDYKPSAS
jgi:hypothetical protein